jgi:hypothetical protein
MRLKLLPLWLWLAALVLVTFFPPEAKAHTRDRKPVGLVICRTFGSSCAKAVEVSFCESGMRPDAVSRTRDVGLFQINYHAHRKRGESFAAFKRRMSDPERNAAFAYRLSRGGRDWSPWKWSQHCWGRA